MSASKNTATPSKQKFPKINSTINQWMSWICTNEKFTKYINRNNHHHNNNDIDTMGVSLMITWIIIASWILTNQCHGKCESYANQHYLKTTMHLILIEYWSSVNRNDDRATSKRHTETVSHTRMNEYENGTFHDGIICIEGEMNEKPKRSKL